MVWLYKQFFSLAAELAQDCFVFLDVLGHVLAARKELLIRIEE